MSDKPAIPMITAAEYLERVMLEMAERQIKPPDLSDPNAATLVYVDEMGLLQSETVLIR